MLQRSATPQMTQAILANTPVGRVGAPMEVASAVLWLSGEGASFVTGHAMVVDGGCAPQ